jgi:hypothetical protein
MVEFPTVPGVAKRPVLLGPDCVVVFNNGNEAVIKAGAELAYELSAGDTDYVFARMMRLSPIKGFTFDTELRKGFLDTLNIMNDNGVYQWAMTSVWFPVIRQNLMAAMEMILVEGENVKTALEFFEDQTLAEMRY